MAAADMPEIPIGTPVRYWTGCRPADMTPTSGSSLYQLAGCDCPPEGKTSRTRSAPHLLGGHTSVVWVEGEPSCIALTHVQVLEPTPENRPAGRGTCPRCNQNRVLWPFTPQHQEHWDEGARLRCPWCRAIASAATVNLCLDCRTAEVERAEAAPLDLADATILRLVAAQSGLHDPTVPAVAERRES